MAKNSSIVGPILGALAGIIILALLPSEARNDKAFFFFAGAVLFAAMIAGYAGSIFISRKGQGSFRTGLDSPAMKEAEGIIASFASTRKSLKVLGILIILVTTLLHFLLGVGLGFDTENLLIVGGIFSLVCFFVSWLLSGG